MHGRAPAGSLRAGALALLASVRGRLLGAVRSNDPEFVERVYSSAYWMRSQPSADAWIDSAWISLTVLGRVGVGGS